MGFFTNLLLKNYRNCARKVIADFKFNFASTKKTMDESYRIFQATTKILRIDDNDIMFSGYSKLRDICETYTGAIYLICSTILTDKRTMKMRVAQLFGIIDYEMIQAGLNMCSLEEKKKLYRFFGVLDLYELNPGLFNFHL